MRITVFGMWHLGCVTAACLASAGHQVVALDPDTEVIANLQQGKPPLQEPGLAELIQTEFSAQRLTFTSDASAALQNTEILWVTFDTPVNDRDEADVAFVRQKLESVSRFIQPGTLILISSQVPVGFTRDLARDWEGKALTYAYSPENLRLGKALYAFRHPERVILGMSSAADKEKLAELFSPFCEQIVWMSVESAEMTKHALNAFLATSVTFINEIARLCEALGADAREVERGLKSEGRIGSRAYLAPGGAFAGGTLARDVRYLIGFGETHQVHTPLFQGVLESNQRHANWTREKLATVIRNSAKPVITILGLTYTAGTSTLRRSASVELAQWLHQQGVQVRAHDPAVESLPNELQSVIQLCTTAGDALSGSDAAVIGTELPVFRELSGDTFVKAMRQPLVIDPNWFLSGNLKDDQRIAYYAIGKETKR